MYNHFLHFSDSNEETFVWYVLAKTNEGAMLVYHCDSRKHTLLNIDYRCLTVTSHGTGTISGGIWLHTGITITLHCSDVEAENWMWKFANVTNRFHNFKKRYSTCDIN